MSFHCTVKLRRRLLDVVINRINLIAVLFLLFTLYFGVHFKLLDFENSISTYSDSLFFQQKSLALANLHVDEKSLMRMNSQGFSIEFQITPLLYSDSHIRRVLLLSESNGDNIFVYLWKKRLGVIINKSYWNFRAHNEFSVAITEGKHTVKIKQDNKEFSLYLNGIKKKHFGIESNKFSFDPKASRLIFGGNESSLKSWNGSLHSFSISSHFANNPLCDDFCENKKELDFIFQKDDPHFLKDRYSKNKILLPRKVRDYERVLLRNGLGDLLSKMTVVDVILNYLWFFFLSLFLYIYFIINGIKSFRALAFSLVISIFSSLLIEYLQSWLPGRDSNIRDLLLNSLGGTGGCLFAYKLKQRIEVLRRFLRRKSKYRYV
jgi:hypothetical protein